MSRRAKLLMLAALLLAFGIASAADLLVEGELAYTAYTGSGKLFFHSVDRFACRRSLSAAENWIIRLEASPEATNAPLWSCAYYEVGGESNCIYRLRRSKPETLSAVAATDRAAANLPWILGQARIFPSKVPPCEPGYYLGPIWLAFGSASFFRGQTSGTTPPLWPAPIEVLIDGRYSCKYTAEFPSPLSGASRVVFFSQGVYPEDRSGRVSLKPYRKPFDESFTNAVFEVTAMTNFQGQSVPLAFRLTQYGPRPNAATRDDLAIGAEWVGSVRALRLVDSLSDYKPVLADGVNSFEDYRVGGVAGTPLRYTTSDQVWMASPEDLHKSKAKVLDRIRELLTGQRSPGTPSQLGIVLVLLVSSCIAGVALYFRLRANRRLK